VEILFAGDPYLLWSFLSVPPAERSVVVAAGHSSVYLLHIGGNW
jgi:hypothetical protein